MAAKPKPEPVTTSRIYYAVIEFTLPAVLAMIKFDHDQFDRRDRELIPGDWQIETTGDYAGTCSVTFSKEDGVPFTDEEIEKVRAAVEGIEQTYWLMTRKNVS